MKGLRHIKQWSARARYGITRRALSALRRIRSVNYLDSYVTSAPGPQNALGIFQGEWSSILPAPLTDFQAGSASLFNDSRVTWFVEEVGGIEGRSVLELGPLEGGHSFMFERLGAREVIAIEANTRAYLKCLIIKELLDLRRVRFLCGDFLEYLRTDGTDFDLVFASGVLYHMRNPAELIALMAQRCRQHLFLWTHYYVPSLSASHLRRFTTSDGEHAGFRHTLYRQKYGSTAYIRGFCGGSAPFCCWMSRDDILRCLDYFGFNDIRIGFDQPDHPNGPAFAVTATRRIPS
jgi:Protein of unknown function (DUF1698)